MKRYMKTAAAFFTAALLALSLTIGAFAAVPVHAEETEGDDTGYFLLTLLRMGEEELDEESLGTFGMVGGIILEEGGSGYIYIFDEVTELEWKDNVLIIEGEEAPYIIDGDTLEITIEDGDESMLLGFTRTDEEAPTREEVADMLAGMATGEEEFEEEFEEDFDFEDSEEQTVIVEDVYELMDSIDDYTTIILMPGEYNVTEWLEEGNAEKWDQDAYETDGYVTYGLYYDEVFDGEQLIINNFDNLTLMSSDKNDPAVIVCDPRYADVIRFVDCDNLVLDHLVMGHSDGEGYCTGNVLGLIYSWYVTVTDCDFYGCGAYGLYIDDCNDVAVNDSYIHDCTYGCAVIDASTVTVKHTEFVDCKEFTMFEVTDSTVDFIDCLFYNLEGEFMNELDDYSEVNLIVCGFDDDVTASIEENPSYEDNLNVY